MEGKALGSPSLPRLISKSPVLTAYSPETPISYPIFSPSCSFPLQIASFSVSTPLGGLDDSSLLCMLHFLLCVCDFSLPTPPAV